MYRGFRQVWDGFTKNVAWAYTGPSGVVLFALTVLLLAVAMAPAVVLIAAAVGASVPTADVRLAAALFASSILVRAILARALRGPIWPAATHALMAAVWTGIIGRSFYWKLVRKEVLWRGRRYDAAGAGF
jgi:hypothetical protein